MTALRKALAALFLVFATVAFALTPGERVVLFSGIKPVWQANFLGASSLPAGLTWTVPTTLRTLYDSTGKLTYGGNNMIVQSENFTVSPWGAAVSGTSTRTNGGSSLGFTVGVITATSANGGIRQVLTGLQSGAPYIWSFYIKSTATTVNALFENGAGAYGSAVSVLLNPTNGTWLSVVGITTITSTPTADGGYIYTLVVPPAGASLQANLEFRLPNIGDSITIGRPQFEAVTYQTAARPYVATTSAAYYGPRFDYDPSTLAPAGLLVEEPRVQYAQYSQNFGTGWTSPGGATTITTASGVTSPDGTSQMALLTQTNTSGLIYGNSTGLTTTGTNYVSSGYFKAGASSPAPYFEIAFTDVSGSYAIAYFNSSTGAYVTSAAARGSIVSYGSTLISNGIWRCWVVASFTTITTGLRSLLNVASDTSGNTVAGQTGYVWGAQVEAGSFPTSYIPNPTSSTVTRTADVVQFNGVPLAALRKTPLTLAVEAQIPYPINNYAIVGSAGAGSPVDLLAVNNGLQTNALVYDSTVGNVSVSNGSANWSSIARAVMATSAAGSSVDISGGTVATTSTPLGTNRTSYNFGLMARDDGLNQLSGWVRSAAIYNQRLPDAKLKSLSVVGAPW